MRVTMDVFLFSQATKSLDLHRRRGEMPAKLPPGNHTTVSRVLDLGGSFLFGSSRDRALQICTHARILSLSSFFSLSFSLKAVASEQRGESDIP
jgi:hypothetical protein